MVTLEKANVGFIKLKGEFLEESNLTVWYTWMGTQKPQRFHSFILYIEYWILSIHYHGNNSIYKIAQSIDYCLIAGI